MNWDQIQGNWQKIKNRINAGTQDATGQTPDRNQLQTLLEPEYGAGKPAAEATLQAWKDKA
ncbi:hypothetical protein [Dinoroseobacter sp. S375]|uniref:hypothetical protein n=1 Tax=Dinoroseobacter sp. S375 TaxID=3415136 RepID=UPI003C7E3DD1